MTPLPPGLPPDIAQGALNRQHDFARQQFVPGQEQALAALLAQLNWNQRPTAPTPSPQHLGRAIIAGCVVFFLLIFLVAVFFVRG